MEEEAGDEGFRDPPTVQGYTAHMRAMHAGGHAQYKCKKCGAVLVGYDGIGRVKCERCGAENG